MSICNNCVNPKKDKNLCTFNRTTDPVTKKVTEHCDYRIIAKDVTPRANKRMIAIATAHAMKPPENLPQPRNTRQYVRTERKIGRNEHCPCGSGKKFKKCHIS